MDSYRELKAWQKAMELIVEIYRICKYLPKEETNELSGQMRRSAVSIASNIAEGQARDSNKTFIRFFSIAQGSKAELETQIEIYRRLNYIPENKILISENLASETGRILRKLIRKLQEPSSLPTTKYQLTTKN